MRYLLLLFIIFFTAQALNAETLISQITEAIEQASPDSKFQYYQYRARAYSRNNMPEAALADLTASINLNPAISAYRERIDLLIKMGRYKEAINDLNIILKDYPHDLQTYRLRSKTYYNMEQYKKHSTISTSSSKPTPVISKCTAFAAKPILKWNSTRKPERMPFGSSTQIRTTRPVA